MSDFPLLQISTERLLVIASTIDLIRAELESPERLAELLKAAVPDDWPPGEYDRGAQEFFCERLQEGGAAAVGWYGWYAVLRGNSERSAVLIGAGGYFGPPTEAGEVEIGYSMVPAWQGQGYAAEMVRLLVHQAFAVDRVRRIVAHTAAQNVASCRLLKRLGFRQNGADEKSGNIRFEIERVNMI
jgi:RimJ/RimL family protein N-acetyltransferase